MKAKMTEAEKDACIVKLEDEIIEFKAVVKAYDDVVNKVLPREIAILFMNSTPGYYIKHKHDLLDSKQVKRMMQ